MERTRTFNWQNPLDGAQKATTMSGMEYLQAMNKGDIALPPLLHTLDFVVHETEPGEVIFGFTPQEFHYNPIGTVHGGVISAILDSAMGCSLHTLLEAGTGYTTLELKVNFIKAITIQTGPVRAIGKVINQGGRTALTEAKLVDANGKLLAHATSTCLILKHK
ncbi:MAG TPA: PaaI family thioesterase [Chitinophagales bacterium]|nr:PaaI family thioesterase [Chitinophagales bacterium]